MNSSRAMLIATLMFFVVSSAHLSYAGFWTKAVKESAEALTKKGVTHGGDSRKLRKVIGIAGKAGWDAHHIIPISAKHHRALQKIGFDFDTVENGIALPSRAGVDPRLPIHSGNHPEYTKAVVRDLDAIPASASVERTEKMVRSIISKYRSQLESGVELVHTGAPSPWK